MSLLKIKYFIFVSLGIIFVLTDTLLVISKDGVVEERKGFETIIKNSLTKKAESGDGKAAYCLSMNYEYQRKRDSKEKYMYWLHKAAELGNADAQHDLGSDSGVNSREGIKLLRMAAEQGHSTAQIILGDLSYSESNIEQAEYWYRKSAMQGSLTAILHLSKLLNNTKTQKKDLIEGYAWSSAGLSRCHPRSGFTGMFKEEQEATIKKATKLGYEKAAFIKQAEIEADKINKNIRVIWVTPSWEDCQEFGSK
jgi:hypothetical protein